MFTFGIPFTIALLGATYLLAGLTQTRLDYHDAKVKMMTKKEELKIDKNKKKFDLQEEYFRLTSGKDYDDWDMVRVNRPEEDEPIFKRQ
ncbi:Cytochrome oxidase assembly [Irineochytrium annulatum]|nr:Cytochrome oxidase assembly [Irineochytrium annulatum]